MSQLCMVLIITPIHQLERFGEKTFALNVGEKQFWRFSTFHRVLYTTSVIHSLCWAVELEGGGISPERVWIGRVSPSKLLIISMGLTRKC
jgi:hypothetical protein